MSHLRLWKDSLTIPEHAGHIDVSVPDTLFARQFDAAFAAPMSFRALNLQSSVSAVFVKTSQGCQTNQVSEGEIAETLETGDQLQERPP